jgi:hypothetical protein
MLKNSPPPRASPDAAVPRLDERQSFAVHLSELGALLGVFNSNCVGGGSARRQCV